MWGSTSPSSTMLTGSLKIKSEVVGRFGRRRTVGGHVGTMRFLINGSWAVSVSRALLQRGRVHKIGPD